MKTAPCWFLVIEKQPLIVPLNFSGSKLNTASSGVRHTICWFFLPEGCSSTPSLAVSSRGLAASSVLLKSYFGILAWKSQRHNFNIFHDRELMRKLRNTPNQNESWWITWFLRDGLKYFGISPLFGEDFHIFYFLLTSFLKWIENTTYPPPTFPMRAVFDGFVALSSCCCPEGYPSSWRGRSGSKDYDCKRYMMGILFRQLTI